MNILLIGGAGSFINDLIIKFNKEGHRVYLLTGNRYGRLLYHKVFERYDFTYDSSCLSEVFESVGPDVTICMGAYDTNFRWQNQETEAVKYSSSLMNILMAYAMSNRGRFIYLSSEAVYDGHYPENITEQEPASPMGLKGMALAQVEAMCESYRKTRGLDIVTLRMDHLCVIPKMRRDATDICCKMCIEALKNRKITIQEEKYFSLLYEMDAIEFIHNIVTSKKHREALYNISSGVVISQRELAETIRDAFQEEQIEIVAEVEDEEEIESEAERKTESYAGRKVLSNVLYDSEFGNPACWQVSVIVGKIVSQVKKNSAVFLKGADAKLPLVQRILKKAGWFWKALVPFLENLVLFIPFFMLNNRAVGSSYFGNLDFYLLYVLLFAIVYGQQQATVSAVLSVAGYCFRQMYNRTGFEVMLDANTYVWIAQLFILGLAVGYMRDQIAKLKKEAQEEKDFLSLQLSDVQDINSSNVRVKDALETQIVNQYDSVGKIYSITSALDQYSPEEVLFYAAEMLGKLVRSKDVAIYTVSNAEYARLFSSTSTKARMLGRSIPYTRMGEMSEDIANRKVFINRKMDQRYPLMAHGIYDNDEMQMILMVWGIPWERMTLGQANQLVVISALIQNAVVRANKYMSALDDQRYVGDTQNLETEAFTSLMKAYLEAQGKGLTECAMLKIEADPGNYMEAGKILSDKLRPTDYIGTLSDGGLYVLLSNTNMDDARLVITRFAEVGYESYIVRDGNG